MFSWIKQDESRKKTTDVYESVSLGLRDIYKSKLLPLEKE
jgi:hypothetical protein